MSVDPNLIVNYHLITCTRCSQVKVSLNDGQNYCMQCTLVLQSAASNDGDYDNPILQRPAFETDAILGFLYAHRNDA